MNLAERAARDRGVLVVGSANADLMVTAERRPGGGETVLGGDTEILPGGKGANCAVAAARLGAAVSLLAAVGADAYGHTLLDSLHDSGVDTALVRRVPGTTGIAYITVTPDGENSILVSPGANSALTPGHVDEALASRAGGVLVASMEVPQPTVARAVTAGAAAGLTTLLNLSPAAPVDPETLRALDVLLVNEHEAAWLLGGTTADTADAENTESTVDSPGDFAPLLDLGPAAALVTLGARGVLLLTAAGRTEIPSPSVRAVDTTGAGDAFTGALAAALAAGHTLEEAARRAVRVAAISVTRRGAQPSYPTAAELG